MRTTRLPTVRVLLAATTCQHLLLRHTHYPSGHTHPRTYWPHGRTHLGPGIYPPPEGTCVPRGQTHTCENVILPQLLMRAVIIDTHQHICNINTAQRLEDCEGMPGAATHFHLHNITIKCGNFLNVLLLLNCNWYPSVLWWYVPEIEMKPVGIQTRRSIRDTKDGLFHNLFVLSTILDNFGPKPFNFILSNSNWLFSMPEYSCLK